jgi:integrase
MARVKAKSRKPNGSGQVVRDGDKYRARVAVGIDPATGRTKYRQCKVDSQAEAVEALIKMQSELRAGQLTSEKGDTLETFATRWLEKVIRPNRAPNTYRQYEWIVRDHILPHLGKKRASNVTQDDVQALMNAKATQTVKPKAKTPGATPTKTLDRVTLGHIRRVLFGLFEAARTSKLVGVNPVADVVLPREAKSKAPIFLDARQAGAFAKAAGESDLCELFVFMLSTGTRLGEATGIRWQDIDFQEGCVHVRGQLQRVAGKLVYLPTTKTNQDRRLPLSPGMLESLRQLKAKQLVEGWEDADGVVFLNAYGRRLDGKFVTNRLAEVCRAAGVPVISPHKLRHTAATLMLAETGSLHMVQKVLGHQQQRLTADLYGHASADILRPGIDVLDRIIRG